VADGQMAKIRQVLETGQGCNSISLSQVLGEKRWYNTTIEPLRGSTGAVVSGLVIARDIHEFKMAQDELEAYRERMIRTEQLASLGTLSATLAHELTQPLTVIRLSIQNSLKDLERATCPARVVEDLKDGLMEVSSVTAIAERFRNFARRSAEKVTTKVAVHNIAERVIDLLSESARRSKVTLQTEGLDVLPQVCMPEKDLEQLVFALVQNAIQAADGQETSHFQITGIYRDGHIQLQFADDCGGIADEDLPRVFEPFFTTKPAGEGTGLGLCIVQRVVSDAHGQLQVKTDFGHGATFIITLPIPED
jgi:two-component system, NtrC family, C4-dicarboxylate transport sensor histidine kinase DctB